MSYGYGGQQNPYDQRDNGSGGYEQQQQPSRFGRTNQQYGGGGYDSQNPYSQAPAAPYGGGPAAPYGGGRYNNQNSSIDGGYAGSNVEMAPLAQNAGSMAGSTGPNAILNECKDIDRGIDQIHRNLEQLNTLQQRTLGDADSSANSATNRQLDTLSADTMAMYRSLTERVRAVKSNPESRSPKFSQHVGRIDRRLKDAIRDYQKVESKFRSNTQEQMARQYRIVRPDASEQEVRAAVEDTSNNQVFSQALMQSDRQGRARAALSAVQDRHKALVKIEQQMVELSQLFQDMDTLVVQQEAAIVQIEGKGEEVVDNLDKGNEEMGVAVNTARKTRKKKWICLGICVAIILIVVIIVLIYIFVIRGTNSGGDKGKRAIEGSFAALGNINSHPVDGRSSMDPDVAAEIGRLMKNRIHLPIVVNNA